MSESSDQSSATNTPEGEPGSPGAWLKQERERQGLTTQRIAADMHLSIAAVEAIEANRFATLGAPVFAKGHLRKYATLLGIAADRVVASYDRLDDAPRQVDPIPISQRTVEPALRPSIRDMLGSESDGRQRDKSGALWILSAALIVFAAAGGGWWYLGFRAKQTGESQVQTQAESVPESKGDGDAPSPADSALAPTPVSASTSGPTAAAPAAPAPPPVQKSAGTPPPGKIRLRLTFARESWIEVYDAVGNRMLYGRVDLSRVIDVEPPVTMVVGDAAAVTTEANDKVVTVPQKNISGTVARFAIAADGSVR